MRASDNGRINNTTSSRDDSMRNNPRAEFLRSLAAYLIARDDTRIQREREEGFTHVPRGLQESSRSRGKDKQAPRRLTDAERPVECLIYIVGERAHQEVHGETGAFFYFLGRQIDVQRQQPVGSPPRSLRSDRSTLRRISRYYLTGVDQVLESARRCRRQRERERDEEGTEMTPTIRLRKSLGYFNGTIRLSVPGRAGLLGT